MDVRKPFHYTTTKASRPRAAGLLPWAALAAVSFLAGSLFGGPLFNRMAAGGEGGDRAAATAERSLPAAPDIRMIPAAPARPPASRPSAPKSATAHVETSTEKPERPRRKKRRVRHSDGESRSERLEREKQAATKREAEKVRTQEPEPMDSGDASPGEGDDSPE